jgi:hypothetical protein
VISGHGNDAMIGGGPVIEQDTTTTIFSVWHGDWTIFGGIHARQCANTGLRARLPWSGKDIGLQHLLLSGRAWIDIALLQAGFFLLTASQSRNRRSISSGLKRRG